MQPAFMGLESRVAFCGIEVHDQSIARAPSQLESEEPWDSPLRPLVSILYTNAEDPYIHDYFRPAESFFGSDIQASCVQVHEPVAEWHDQARGRKPYTQRLGTSI